MCGGRLILPVAQGPAGSRATPAAPPTLTPAAGPSQGGPGDFLHLPARPTCLSPELCRAVPPLPTGPAGRRGSSSNAQWIYYLIERGAATF